ncbi:hypothetical protein BDW02DRAFT_489642 [Decorospora gaudefroyi]|uniref:Uncharacterized protein n=1 Tax=Decorospora gaudefroyi TaxID=184978 RepID=A0A6A5KM92_9PLEO|nr:hypothetical protein BDW02DRAFT_489642 [Decorospora gaudefroyi]
MPSFAFWKTAKVDEAREPLLTDGAVAAEGDSVVVAKGLDLDLDPGNDDSGVFLFDEVDVRSPSLAPASSLDTAVESTGQNSTDPFQQPQESSLQHAQTTALPPNQPLVGESISTQPTSFVLHQTTANSPGQDIGSDRSDGNGLPIPVRPTSLTMSNSPPRSHDSSLSSEHTAPVKSSPTPQRTNSTPRRLHRPTELNLGANSAADTSKPRSELQQRYDLIRNSKTQSKAALRSPTTLLKERLNMSPTKGKMDEKMRVFTPPKPTSNGCWLPGPGAQLDAFASTSVRARTEGGKRPAWWCKFDKLVVFDGIGVQDGSLKMHTRTSKGLSIARRRGDMETIIILMDCAHCQEMLNRHEWKYDMRVCKRSVCWDCKERCKWEMEEEKRASKIEEDSLDSVRMKTDGNRYRADSVLQDEHGDEERLMEKVGIEQERPTESA